MKRIIGVIILYTAIVFGACIGISFLYGKLPVLLANAIKPYTFLRGMLWFLLILPSVFISGFMVGCAIQWKTNTENSRQKYSPAMVGRYKRVLGIGLAIVCVLTFSAEVFIPSIEKQQMIAEENPALLKKYMELGKTALGQKHPLLGWQYAQQAFAIYPKDPDVVALYKQAKDAKDVVAAQEATADSTLVKIQTPVQQKDKGYTILELIEKSKQAAAEKKWIDAHYWASLAVTACNGTNTNLAAAKEAANTAWNELNNPVQYDNPEKDKFFARKKEGYAELVKGNDLKAYYIFTELATASKENAADPDVSHYLAIAKERITNQYFFIDETNDLKKIESTRNIYFVLPHSDGSSDVIYVRGIATLKQTGNVVRYLDGLTIVSFDKNKNFVKTMTVSFAKMLEQSVSVFSKEQKKALGISEKIKTVPYIQLQSIDRTTEGVVCRPVYSYELSGLPDEVAKKITSISFKNADRKAVEKNNELRSEDEKVTTLLLPMSYDDFELLNDASFGPARMSFLSLVAFVPQSTGYGFAQVVYSQNLVRRGAYPLFLLILIIFAASFAWNYRLGERDVFQFKWLFLFPIFTGVVYLLIDCCTYLFTLLNYLFVGTCGQFALLIAFIVYVLLLFFVSLNFMARRSS